MFIFAPSASEHNGKCLKSSHKPPSFRHRQNWINLFRSLKKSYAVYDRTITKKQRRPRDMCPRVTLRTPLVNGICNFGCFQPLKTLLNLFLASAKSLRWLHFLPWYGFAGEQWGISHELLSSWSRQPRGWREKK